MRTSRARARVATSVAMILAVGSVTLLGAAPAAQAATEIPGVAGQVQSLALSPGGERLYVPSDSTNQLTIIDTATETISGAVDVGRGPLSVVAGTTPQGERVYTADTRNYEHRPSTVTVVDPVTQTAVASIPVRSAPYGITMSPDGTRVYVGMLHAEALVEIDTATSTAVREIALPGRPHAVEVSPDGAHLYVVYPTLDGGPSLSVLDATDGAVLADVVLVTAGGPAGLYSRPLGMTVSPDGSRLYVTDDYANAVNVVDLETFQLLEVVPVGIYPYGVDISPDGQTVYVANFQGGSLTLIDTETLTTSQLAVATGSPIDVVVSPDGSRRYVADVYSGVVTVFADPQVDLLTPSAGLVEGGTSITITGDRLDGTTSVRFGDVEAAFTVDSDDQITAVLPAAAVPGPVDVVLTSGDGTSQASTFTYVVGSTITGLASPDVELGGAVRDAVEVSGAAGPTGTVSFALHGPGDAGCSRAPVFTAPEVAMVDGAAVSPSYVPEHAGKYEWVASYSGDALHLPSSLRCGSPGQAVVVEPASTSTSLGSSANPSAVGEDVTFTATVGTGFGTATGAVSFEADGVDLGTVAVVGGGASVTTDALGVGAHEITATYSGDSDHRPSSATMVQTVGKVATALELEPLSQTMPDLVAHLTTGDGDPVVGRQVTFTGRLLFFPVTICTATTNATGSARCAGGGLIGLLGSFSATFAGDGTYLPSSATGRLV